jgi:hypothetical protein
MNCNAEVLIENLLAAPNLIGWIDLAYGFAKHGRLHQFVWNDSPTGYEVERMLRDRGVHAYGRSIWRFCYTAAEGKPVKHAQFSCWVSGTQASFAEYNLLGASVPLESPTVSQKNWRNWGRGAAAPTWREGGRPLKANVIERFSDFLAGLLR